MFINNFLIEKVTVHYYFVLIADEYLLSVSGFWLVFLFDNFQGSYRKQVFRK